jgi:glycosyltransferase involved in cell wall biosynthesis
MAGPAVTVVLPTFRRPDALAKAMRSLASQQDPGVEWELIVVDNDEAPGVEAAVHALASHIPAPVMVLRESRRGAAYARNAGIDAAKGDVVAFIDDDVVAAPQWLARLVAPVLDGRAEASGGRVVLDTSVTVPAWLGQDWLGYLSQYDRGTDQRVLDDDYVLSANAAFLTDRLRALSGFDVVLGPRAGSPMVNDDLDLCRRLVAAGGRIIYVPDAVVVHELPAGRLTARYLLRRAYAQGRSDWLLEREVNVRRPLGGAKGMLVHLGQLLGDRVREGPWHPDVAMGAALSVVHTGGYLREAAVRKVAYAREHRR